MVRETDEKKVSRRLPKVTKSPTEVLKGKRSTERLAKIKSLPYFLQNQKLDRIQQSKSQTIALENNPSSVGVLKKENGTNGPTDEVRAAAVKVHHRRLVTIKSPKIAPNKDSVGSLMAEIIAKRYI